MYNHNEYHNTRYYFDCVMKKRLIDLSEIESIKDST